MNCKIDTHKTINDFNKLKTYANKCFSKHDYKQALSAIETASKLMYNFNLIYTDDDMENMLSQIGQIVLKRNNKIKSPVKNNRVIFYDYFAIDNRGLTQQYITALIESGYEILFITYEQKNMKKSERIFLQLNQYEKAKIYTIKKKGYIESAKELYDIINNYDADTVLLHTSPWDVVGILTFSQINDMKR